jgi:type II secretory ATPase GspE/PulE/Tfp pilus assembly ATPase PilB-like protein
MNIKNRINNQEYGVCLEEKRFLEKKGIIKSLKDLAIEHNFMHMEEDNIDLEIMNKYGFFIVKDSESLLTIGVKKYIDEELIFELKELLNKEIKQVIFPVREFEKKFKVHKFIDTNRISSMIQKYNFNDLDKSEILNLFHSMLLECIVLNVSDIHINEYEHFAWIKYRLDGNIEQKYILSKDFISRISIIIKEHSNLDMINSTHSQSGSFSKTFNGNNIDFRVEISPNSYGENIVIRILNKTKNSKALSDVFTTSHPIHNILNKNLSKKNGLFLVVGPTGSGKTTTLNAIINDRERLNEVIYTIEDPIEYKVDFVTQYEVNKNSGNDFATILKSILRQDPDVIMVGEIRDKESMQIVLKSSHSGHLVFSTLHSTTAMLAIQRLKDEEADLFVLSSALNGIIAQRLVKSLCSCKIEDDNPKAKKFFKTDKIGYKSVGCVKCNFTGYVGRDLLIDALFIPSSTKKREDFFYAMRDNDFRSIRKNTIYFSFARCAKYLYESGTIDFKTAVEELRFLGVI